MSDGKIDLDQQQPADNGGQSGFTPPATQADFDRMIADRISRERAKFADYADLKTKAEAFDAATEAAKSEAQKQADALAAANAELAAYKQREQVAAWAANIARGSHVPASALRGSTEAELRAHFAELQALIPAPGAEKRTPDGAPAPIGREPAGYGTVTIHEQIAAAEKAGDRALVGSLKAIQLGAAFSAQ